MNFEPQAYNSLCSTCDQLLGTIRKVDLHTNLVHHESLSTLEESAKNACGICAVLLDHLQSSEFEQIFNLWDQLFPIKCESDTSSVSWQNSFDLAFMSDGVKSLSVSFTLEQIKQTVDKEREYIPSLKTDSPECWSLIRKWLNQCTTNHDRCNALIPEPWFPTRLLDLGTPSDKYIRLVETSRSGFSKQPYGTLSHCWGRNMPTTTTSYTILQHYQNINHAELPKTFRDAIDIARSLHLRYIWIDSLCIVQDSISDWEIEAHKMSQIYRYAFINIAATGAHGSDEGCIFTRDPQKVLPTEFSVQWSNCAKNDVRRYHVVPESRLWARKLVNQPLNRRAWVLQERILAPRLLHFGSEQLFWECREFVACETYYQGLPSSLRGNIIIDIKSLDLGDEPQDDRWPAKYISKSNIAEETTNSRTRLKRTWDAFNELIKPINVQEVTLYSKMQNPSVYRDWNAVVELYSLGALTKETDKLVALSGLASTISTREQTNPSDGYLAGLWHSSLPSHLLWITEKIDKKMIKGKTVVVIPRRYRQYIAPSWSWASIDGRISFMWCRRNHDPIEYLAVLEGAEVTTSGPGRFAQVSEGFLKLSAPLATVLWEPDFDPPSGTACAAKITHIFPRHLGRDKSIPLPPDTSTRAEILFDTIEDDVPEELVLLPVIGIMKRTANENETVFGLVLLQEKGVPETYTRVGFFYTVRSRVSRILRNMPRKSIKIV